MKERAFVMGARFFAVFTIVGMGLCDEMNFEVYDFLPK